MSLLWSDLLVLSTGIAFTKPDAKERPLTRLTMSALQAHWLGLLLSISDVRAQIVHSLLILRNLPQGRTSRSTCDCSAALNCLHLFFPTHA